ncbi:MAG: 5'/3'-nucleotidase SurE [Silicimonas sp.]|nr:5'/3'-nucleotidase SurE [Silicimonas sp.]
MRILITNDDGINAPGLKTLEAIAEELAGPEGEVWIVAPAFEQSGVGHCISYSRPTLLSQFGERRFASEGYPADCVLAGLYEVMKDRRPDLVLSGVNRGNNAAENVLYSGTIGATIEAALQGIPAIALSQFYGPENVNLDDPFEAAAQHGVPLIRNLLENAIWDDNPYRLFYNVNFPPIPAAAVKGTKVTTQGWRAESSFGVQPHHSPTGRMFLWITGGPQHLPTEPGSDVTANLDGYISVTPLRADLTAHDTIETLKAKLEG